jgi:hypothetical protein
MKAFFVLIVFVFLAFPSVSQSGDTLRYDLNEKLNVRTSSNIEKYLNDSEFQYDKEVKRPPANFLQRLLKYIAKFFQLVDKGGKPLEFIIYIIMVAILVFVIVKLLGLNYQSLFLKKKKITTNDLSVFEEDIHQLDIEALIERAVNNREYRLAVRYLYLKLLKRLSTKELIIWEINKTNTDYAKELKQTPYYVMFNRLTSIFEYVWYGEFEPDKTIFDKFAPEYESGFKGIDEKKRH